MVKQRKVWVREYHLTSLCPSECEPSLTKFEYLNLFKNWIDYAPLLFLCVCVCIYIR